MGSPRASQSSSRWSRSRKYIALELFPAWETGLMHAVGGRKGMQLLGIFQYRKQASIDGLID
jgi:hypothetical protein